ncbi:MAG: VCBS repeat-containing protein [Gemmataceae bacterium]
MSSKLTRSRWIRSLFNTPSPKTIRRSTPRLRPTVLSLEDRITPQATLYIDYGDSLPVGGLTGTVDQLPTTKSGSNPAMNGPDLVNSLGAPPTTVFTWQSYDSLYGSQSAANRKQMTDYVRRLYEPFNIAVVELTSTPQIVNGHSVKAASSLADISVTLGANNSDTQHNDSYTMVGQWLLDGTDFVAATGGVVGISNGSDLNGLGGGSNNFEGSVIVTVSSLIQQTPQIQDNTYNGDTIAHENGHSFGLGHVYPNFDFSAAMGGLNVVGQGDTMSYDRLAGQNGVDQMVNIMRYPTPRGNRVEDPKVLSPVIFGTSSGEQFLLDPEIGANPNLEYVSGSGANDKITIQKINATTAKVSVQAFSDPGYNSTIPVAGANWPNQLVYTYDISLSKPLLIDSGAGSDQIILDANLGISIRVRGSSSTDSLIINGTGSEDIIYTPGTNTAANEFDGQQDIHGKIVSGTTSIDLSEFESSSTFTFNNVGKVTYQSPGGADTITAAGLASGGTQISGTVGAGIPTVPLILNNAKSLDINLGTGDVTTTKNTLTFDFTKGNPIPVNGASFTGGVGIDKIVVTANTNFTLSDAQLDLGALGKITLSGVDAATLTGGAGDNIFTLNGWSGAATLDGVLGTDTLNFTQDSNITLSPTKLTTSAGTSVTLNSLENAVLTGGAGNNTFDLTAWLTNATVNGLGGTDTIALTRNANFTATDTLISLSDGTQYTISSVELANLIGGAAANIFDLNGWSGGGSINGLTGTDEVRVTRNADMTLTAGSLTLSAGLPISISSIENASLTGGASSNTFTVNGWNGNATLDGKDGADTYIVTPGTKASTITIADTGADSASDSVQIVGTSSADTYSILPDSVTSGSQVVTYTGVESVSVNGMDGDDTFIMNVNKGYFSGGPFSLDGGTGQNTLVVTGTPLFPIAQSGVMFTGLSTGKVLLDPNGSITPTLNGPLSGDEIVIPFTNMSKIGDTTPADRFNFAFNSGNDKIEVTDGGVYLGVPTVQVYDGIHGVSVANKTLVEITGGGGTDTFSLNTTATVPGVTAFNLIGDSGKDTFNVDAVNLPLNLAGAGDDDSFNLGSTNGLDSITSTVTIDGGTGTNDVLLDASGSGSARTNVVVGPTGVSGLAGTGANTIAFVAGTVSSLVVDGALNFSNTVTVNTLGFPLSLTTGAAADSVTLNAVGATATVLTGAGDDNVQINGISAGLVLLTQDNNDLVSFNSATGTPAGTLDSFTNSFAIDGGTGTNTVVYNDAGSVTGYAYTLGPTGLTRSGGLNLPVSNFQSAKLFGSSVGNNTYAITGLASGVSVVDGTGNGSFNVAGDTLGGSNSFVGNNGNDTFTFTGNGLAAATTVDGGAGTNTASLQASTGDNAMTANITATNAGSVAGAGAGTLGFTSLTGISLDGSGGNNSLVYVDASNSSRAFNYVPTTGNAGNITGPTGTTSVAFTNANKSLTFNGGTNTNDSLTVYAVSTTGSSNGPETTSSNGVDTISISDTNVSIQNTVLGVLRSIAIALTGTVPSAKTLIVRTGNENTLTGDTVTVTPSNRSSIYIYGGLPTSLPGDTLVVNTVGPRAVSLDQDPQGQNIIRVTQLSNGATVGFAQFETAPRPELIAVGSGPGSINRVQAYDAGTGNLKLDFMPFDSSFTGGVSVATGDINGDQYPDIIVGAGPGGPPIVKIFNGINGQQIGEFAAFESTFTGGVQVAAGDVNGDGKDDIILGTGVGGGPRVQAVDGRDLNTRLLNFFAYDPSFRNGVQVAVGDLNGDGKADVVTGAGVGGGPHVRAFDGTNGVELANFFAFNSSFRGGVNVTVGDVNGDGKADIIAAPGSSGNTDVFVYSPAGTLQTQFNASTGSGKILPIANEDGVRLTVADVNGDGILDLVTARGRGTQPVINVFQLGSPTGPTALGLALSENVFDPTFTGGVFVG